MCSECRKKFLNNVHRSIRISYLYDETAKEYEVKGRIEGFEAAAKDSEFDRALNKVVDSILEEAARFFDTYIDG